MPYDVILFSIMVALIVSVLLYGALALEAKLLSRKEPSFRRILLLASGLCSTYFWLNTDEGLGHDHSICKSGSIVSDLRNLKEATLAFLAEHPGSADALPSAPANLISLVKPYADNPKRFRAESYCVQAQTSTWWVGYHTDTTDAATRERLEIRARDIKPDGSQPLDDPSDSLPKNRLYKSADGMVWMSVPVPQTREDRS